MSERNVLKIFGARVREIRTSKGLSQEQLARLADIDRTYIGGIERGERNAGIKNIHRIAAALAVSPSELFRDRSGHG
jgi:transcriptional regulator with XRE-family HTH domain